MACIIPFKGLRYNPDKAGSLADLVTPPYDVIDAAAQDCYYRRHPYNIIRLEYGKTYPEDNENNNRYTRSAKDFKSWLSKQVLTQEASPALYLYEQEFTLGGEKRIRSGFFGGVRLEPYEKGIILPHEETMPKHKADRLALMRACEASFSPIFGLYADRENTIISTMRENVKNTAPDVDFTDEDGYGHRMWVITDSRVIGRVQQTMGDKQIFIADGHHRYETALNYKKERESGSIRPGGDSAVSAASSCSTAPDGSISCSYTSDPVYNYTMMTLVNLYDPGLVVLPTHRLIENVASLDKNKLIEQLKANFTVEEYILKPDKSNFREILAVMEEKMQPGGAVCPADTVKHRHAFCLYAGDNKIFMLSLKDNIDVTGIMPQDRSKAWQGLDVSVLHSLIIEKHLGICGELRAKAEHITYSREEEGALDQVDRGEYQLAFFLNPTLVEEVTEIAGKGEKMPQKSTFFYPKVKTGIVMYKL
ncbi:MAG: DUF1015 domain-containing protein [Peptococcaceae bacterium]|nr:DUF1015 domain-containing protein [Peptococcaceae bacterium]